MSEREAPISQEKAQFCQDVIDQLKKGLETGHLPQLTVRLNALLQQYIVDLRANKKITIDEAFELQNLVFKTRYLSDKSLSLDIPVNPPASNAA